MSLAHPWILALLIAVPLIAWFARALKKASIAPLPGVSSLPAAPATWRLAFRWLPAAMRLSCLALLIVAFARPQGSTGWTSTSTEGVAMQIVFDRSGSMREAMGGTGEEVSKIERARKTVVDFVQGDGALKGRTGDMIGLIAFARYADTLSPLARSHESLIDAVKRVQPAEGRAEDGTAIGDALALAAARLKRAEEDLARSAPGNGAKPDYTIKSKIIILMTDGQNNAGEASPYEAAAQAKEWGIRVYTIGIGAGERMMTMDTLFGTQRIPMGNDVDERMLKQVAETTGGEYFSAASPDALAGAYAAIDKLETSRIDAQEHLSRTELFAPFAAAALTLLGLELLLSGTVFRRVA